MGGAGGLRAKSVQAGSSSGQHWTGAVAGKPQSSTPWGLPSAYNGTQLSNRRWCFHSHSNGPAHKTPLEGTPTSQRASASKPAGEPSSTTRRYPSSRSHLPSRQAAAVPSDASCKAAVSARHGRAWQCNNVRALPFNASQQSTPILSFSFALFQPDSWALPQSLTNTRYIATGTEASRARCRCPLTVAVHCQALHLG
jgi:hypothetical protein